LSHEPVDRPRYIVPTWPDEPFVLLAEKGKFDLGSFTADYWSIDEDNVLYCSPPEGGHPVQLRVTMQIGDLLLANNGDMGPMTYRIVPASAYRPHGIDELTLVGDPFDILGKFAALLRFVDQGPLALTIESLEEALAGCDRDDVQRVLDKHVLTPAALEAGCVAREKLGRLSDVIHAAAIALILPHLLEPGEHVTHASLAVRTDPTDPFDLHTNRRVARFQLTMWDGADARRDRLLVRDLVHLAHVPSTDQPELYVLGEWAIRFLAETDAPVGWAIDRFPATRRLFHEHFGDLSIPIHEFRSGPAAHVRVTDLGAKLSQILAGC